MSLRDEQLVSFPDASKRLPSRPSINTFHRWRMRGIKGHRLETCRLAGRRYTSVEALDRFFDAVDAEHQPQKQAASITPKQRQASIEAAEQILAAAGV